MSEMDGSLRWGVERRLAFLDACLFWAGRVNRSDIVKRFGISPQQASADLARYVELAPGNATYDRSRKTYVRTSSFTPVIGAPSAEEILDQLEGPAVDSGRGELAPWAAGVVAERAVPRSPRSLDDSVLQKLLSAVRDRHMVSITYRSFSSSEPSERRVAPHSFADDGDRWHVRAYCDRNRDFRDFVLSRITAVADCGMSTIEKATDFAWNGSVTLELAPNPRLDAATRLALETEYSMEHGRTCMTVRICFAYYTTRRLGMDIDSEMVDPHRQQLVLVNADEINAAEKLASQNTRSEIDRILAE